MLAEGKSYLLQTTSKGKWSSFKTHIPAGITTLQWYLFSEEYYSNDGVSTQLKLKSVRVTGRPATINCPECEPGYYSDSEGRESCLKCPENTYSGKGAVKCESCAEGEYSRKHIF